MVKKKGKRGNYDMEEEMVSYVGVMNFILKR
jgi:hypothetical protein